MYGIFDNQAGSTPKTVDRIFRFDRQWKTIRSDEFYDKGLSKPSVWMPYSTQTTIIRPVRVRLFSGLGARSSRCQEGIELFFIHLRAVWWLIPKVLARPRDELRSWAALTTISLNSSSLRTDWNTPPKPQVLHLYLGLPEPFEPFLTICSEPHLWQHLTAKTISKNLVQKY